MRNRVLEMDSQGGELRWVKMLCEGPQIAAQSQAGVLEIAARGPPRFAVLVHPVKSSLKNKTKVQY